MKIRDMMESIEKIQDGIVFRNEKKEDGSRLKGVLNVTWGELETIWIRLNRSLELEEGGRQ